MQLSKLTSANPPVNECFITAMCKDETRAYFDTLTRVEVSDSMYPAGAVCVDGMIALTMAGGKTFCFVDVPGMTSRHRLLGR